MDPTRQMILYVGTGLAVTVYLLWKLFSWFRNRKSSNSANASQQVVDDPYAIPEPKRRSDVVEQPAAAAPAVTPPVIPAAPQPVVPPKPTPTAAPVAVDDADDYEEYPYADKGDYVFGSATPILAAMVPSSPENRERETRNLRNAGFYSPHAWHNFNAYRYLAIVLPVLACGLLLVISSERLEPFLVGGMLLLPLIGWALPAVYIQNQAQSRVQRIAGSMPDMLDLLNMCVSQGMTVQSSLGRVSKDIQPVHPDLAKELRIVTEQARVGSLDQALTGFSQRVDAPEVHSFTSLLIQTERMGTSVSEALGDYSDNIRQSMRQRADEKANSAAFWMLFPTVFCLMTAVFLFLMGPAIIQLTDFANNRADVLNTTDAVNVLNQE
ncbi:MAG: type II secretion system F family protein [Planctomycetaceae bacterium]|nr:type II secretion system F family protein [Planctomycetaceae bacterium]MCB9954223.1 type II secretion system F family protein [Planctomycetaceae bacterium]